MSDNTHALAGIESHPQGKGARIGAFLDEWWPEIILGLNGPIGIAASVFSGVEIKPIGLDITVDQVCLVVAIIAIICGGMGVAAKNQTIQEIKDSEEQLRHIVHNYQKDTRELIQDSLRDLARDCGLNSGQHACRTDTRISVYCHDSDNQRFIPVARISGDPEFEKKGRPHYPDSQGIICKAWRNESCSYQFSPEPKICRESGPEPTEESATKAAIQKELELWQADQAELFKIPAGVSAKFAMKSKSAIAWRIEYRDTKIGVVVIESTNGTVAAGKLQEDVESSSHFPPLQRALYRINESHIRNIANRIAKM